MPCTRPDLDTNHSPEPATYLLSERIMNIALTKANQPPTHPTRGTVSAKSARRQKERPKWTRAMMVPRKP